MTARRLAAQLLLVGLFALATACGGGDLSGAPPAPAAEPPATTAPPAADETRGRRLLAELDLEPNQDIVEIAGSRDGSDLALTITVPQDAPGEYTFADGLYGAQAFAVVDGAWKRVDTADIRTEIAPLLSPGQERGASPAGLRRRRLDSLLRLPRARAGRGLRGLGGHLLGGRHSAPGRGEQLLRRHAANRCVEQLDRMEGRQRPALRRRWALTWTRQPGFALA